MTPDLPHPAPGEVWLVGAGPGDPGLLTLLAARALAEADIVVHDALVSPEVLALARAGARILPAGKRGGRPSACQPDISARLVAEARAGARVVRLKGGDPLVFGRGGEEALALAAAGLPFRIVPGVTAGIGGLAYAGVPATHRSASSVLTFISGHRPPAESGLDWAALARGSPTLVFYMALSNIAAIADCLLAHGRAGAEPAAIVCHAATARQRVIDTTLAGLGRAAEAAEPPAVIALGPIAAGALRFDWLAGLPPAGGAIRS